MNSSATISKLSAALTKAQGEMRHAQKSGDNKFDKYRYSKLEDFFDASKATLAKHGLAISISTTSVENLPDRITKSGGAEHACQVQVCATLIHESGEWIEALGFGEGQDRADKAIYKAITGARKYVLAGLLAIPTTDDPEADEQVGHTTPSPAPRATWTAEQKAEVDKLCVSIRSGFGKDGEARLAVVRSKASSGTPSEAIDLVRALLEDLNQTKNQGASK